MTETADSAEAAVSGSVEPRISYVIAPTTPDEYDQIVRAQIEGLSALVLAAGLKPK